jgi:hypothetical protein
VASLAKKMLNVLKTMGWKVTKNLHLQPHKITQVQVTGEGSVLDQKLTFSLAKPPSVCISMLKTTCTGAVLIQDVLLKRPFTIRRLMCGVPLLLCEEQDTVFVNTINSVICQWHSSALFLRALQKKKYGMLALQHMLPLIPLMF